MWRQPWIKKLSEFLRIVSILNLNDDKVNEFSNYIKHNDVSLYDYSLRKNKLELLFIKKLLTMVFQITLNLNMDIS